MLKLDIDNRGSTRTLKKMMEDSSTMLYQFVDKISVYSRNSVIKQYLKILGVDPTKFSEKTDYSSEAKKMIKSFFTYPTIFREICLYLSTKKSKLEFLRMYSDEQRKYITSLDTSDSKLISCAGSGKTRTIIGRIKFMVEHGLAKKEEVFAITFSKHAANDFHQKIKDLFPDFVKFCNLKNFSTIDSLAKSILCRMKSHKSENVEILSIALRNYLKGITDTDTKLIYNIKPIRHLFVDEAQDLNEIQYEIVLFLQEKFGTSVGLIGDPNQNIYQFRRSSSSYLINFPGRKYELTKNFRSTQQIVDFSESIKPIKTSRSISATERSGPKVAIITKPLHKLHKMMIKFIHKYSKKRDISNIAIICPTRGIGSVDNLGLSVFFNLFKMNDIPFNQLYDESGNFRNKIKNVGRIKGHINLITYHGTKGLEFDVVFVMDFYHFLFNKKPSKEEHKINQYLLYVATSRAKNMMFVCTYTNMYGGYLNHWITKIPANYYVSNTPLKIPKLSFRENDVNGNTNGITDIITEISDEHLDMIHDMLNITEGTTLFSRRIYRDFTHIDRGKDYVLFGIFCEELFYLMYHLSRKMVPRRMPLIQMIIESRFVVVGDDSDYKLLKNFVMKNKLTWKRYDIIRNNVGDRITHLMDKYFSREIELDNCIICTNEFVKIIDINHTDIKTSYQKYLDVESYQYDYRQILTDFFYLIVVQYAYKINHYYYINNHGKDKQVLLQNGMELYEELNRYVRNNYLACNLMIKVPVYYPKLMLCGEIDFIEKYPSLGTENIVEVKCVTEISIKYYIQLLLYNFCYYYGNNQLDKLFYNKFKLINLLTGLEHYLLISVSPEDMFNILLIMAESGNLKFRNLNLVYDLETTGMIRNVGPYNSKPKIPRCSFNRKNNKYYGQILPEITEIAIRDYDTGMVLLNTLVKPYGKIQLEAQKKTGITLAMLADKPRIETVRYILEKKMKNFVDCKMMSHNGTRFDRLIMVHEKLVDSNRVSFLDTLSIIPIHLPPYIKLENKKLKTIYHQLFGKDFVAHRAMADVNALIKIMRYLKIEF